MSEPPTAENSGTKGQHIDAVCRLTRRFNHSSKRFRGNAAGAVLQGGRCAIRAENLLIQMSHDLEKARRPFKSGIPG